MKFFIKKKKKVNVLMQVFANKYPWDHMPSLGLSLEVSLWGAKHLIKFEILKPFLLALNSLSLATSLFFAAFF